MKSFSFAARQGSSWGAFLALWLLSACTHTMPTDAPMVHRVLGDKALREQLVEQGTADAHFVHQILHQLGKGSNGDQKFARLLAEHLGHHPSTARATFQEVAQSKEFQEWLVEQLRRRAAER